MATRGDQSSSDLHDHAGRGVHPGADVLGSTADGPGGLERLRELIRTSDGFGWARRHPLARAGLVAGLVVVAAGIAGTSYVRTRPPAPDPVVALTITGNLNADLMHLADGGASSDRYLSPDYSFGSFDAQGRFTTTSTYVVTTQVPGDVDTLLGVVGPGLINPTSTIARVDVANRGIGSLGATVDCSDTRWWDAHETDYRVRVSRTDRYGQVTTYDAPFAGPMLHVDVGGEIGTGWHVLVRTVCVDTLLRKQPRDDTTT